MERAQERIMLDIKKQDRITADHIRSRTKCEDVLEKIGKLKWRWAGKVMRQSDERWTKRVSEWTPREGKRKRGRPRKRWASDLEDFKNDWHRFVYDKNSWSYLGNHFVKHFTNALVGKTGPTTD